MPLLLLLPTAVLAGVDPPGAVRPFLLLLLLPASEGFRGLDPEALLLVLGLQA